MGGRIGLILSGGIFLSQSGNRIEEAAGHFGIGLDRDSHRL